MNRKERRRNKAPMKDPVYMMKPSQIKAAAISEYQKVKKEELEAAYNRGRKDAIDRAFLMMIAIPIKVLHEFYGWRSKKRLPEFAELITDEYQRFADGDVTVSEYKQLVFEQCGIKFELAEDD